MFGSVIRTLRGTNLRVPNPIYAVQARGWHADGEGAVADSPATPVGKRFGKRESRESRETRETREVGLYVDQRDDVVMKPRRPYFSSADKAVRGEFWADFMFGVT